MEMELLRTNLSKVRIPEPTNRIYKQECCISFDTPKSEGGLFVDMNTFLAFGKDYVGWNFEKTGNPVYLHIKQTKKPIPEDRPLKKPTLLAIGIDGGFDNQELEYDETYNIVILPDYVTFPFPSVALPEKVRLAVDAILIAEGAERKEQVASWTADKKQTSEYALTLKQIDNGVIIPPSGWKCAKCDKTDNLWLNLTDGMILCGRKLWDGSGGNNHAIDHYNETRYPLAVKLGTITSDLEGADVFSYPEDESVTDPLLAEHLAFFGIDFSSLQKTEMTTAEKELDQNTNFDWNRIQESGQEVEPLVGPGYTGLVNLGNSCYLAATMQVVFSTHSFCSRYYMNQNLKTAFDTAPADPTVDLNMQLTKLANGLLSGKYSVPAVQKDDVANAADSSQDAKQEGVRPRMFKAVIAASHPEFSTMRQQDALEFFLHLIDQVERVNAGKPELDPGRSFKFGIEERLQCPSGKVAYNKRHDYILSLSIPLEKATNKKELEEFHKLKAREEAEGKEMSSDEIVRPRVPLSDCLNIFSAPEEVPGFYSTALNAKTTAIKTAGLTSFPDYLVLHMRKFVMEAGWVPKKLDVYIDVDDIIDISHMRSKGLQPGEELLPEGGPGGQEESEKLLPNEDIVSQLASMGFNHLHCQKAAINTSNAGVEEAMNWLLSHMDDPDIDAPIHKEAESNEVDPSKVATLVSFGFEEEIARKALKASGGDIEKATDWIFNPTASGPSDMDATSSSGPTVDATLPDGDGKYRLFGLVSHIGTSTQCGHYVAHVYKEGRWVIFNDDKVGISKNPPKDMAYLYFYERIRN
ncbi:ubiquitin carboxyl-terminal hydrolase 14 isoform X1 [Cynara cardunculus var. scolymus]|uniref:ubiquitin carboxyl-terminal hydrolase 14 isoform X1 n=1 Tax=Cynara cardunculus var. scolymus TaxID=59895 RepID=UPI000D62AE7D|nr:ubiquitin carboxyl-terminal hydrolase 14 isoform X1 [Cynara cardunculus var. scolymus]